LNFTSEAIFWLFYLGIIVTLAGYGLYNFALTKIEASKAAIFVYLIPIFTLIMAYFILEEKIGFYEYIACIIILIGVLIGEKSLGKSKSYFKIRR
jgi:drug/metabolite transporter (DMT)-like permease